MLMAGDSIPDKMTISLAGRRSIGKNDMMMLEMLNSCNWTRPLYVAITVGESNYMNLGDNFIQEGLASRISPFTTKDGSGNKNYDTEKVYRNVMTRYKFGGLSKKGLYIDETVMRMCYTHRRLFTELAMHLIQEHQNAKALKVLQKVEKEIPEYNIPINYMSGGLDMAQAYALLGNKAKAKHYLNAVVKNNVQYLEWYLSLDGDRFAQSMTDCLRHITMLQQAGVVAQSIDNRTTKNIDTIVNSLYNRYRGKGGYIPEQNQ